MTPRTISITNVAEAFFDACETGKGWEVCSAYCTRQATFSAQAEPLLNVQTLAEYTEWMKGIMTILPDAHLWDSYWAGRSGSTDWSPSPHRLRLCHGIRGRQDRSHDEDLECRPGP